MAFPVAGDSITQTLLPGDVDERTGTWPLHRAFMAGVWDTANKVMRIFGGALTLDSEIRVEDNRQLDELWEYDPLTATWTDLTATSKANSAEFPAARRLPNAFWDSIGNRTIVAQLQVRFKELMSLLSIDKCFSLSQPGHRIVHGKGLASSSCFYLDPRLLLSEGLWRHLWCFP